MGTTVWTTPSSVKFQINRGDVFATDKNHAGHMIGSIDYRGACAWLEIDLGGEPLARGGPFQQRLSIYDAETTLQGVRVRCFISAVTDVLVVEVDDQRSQPEDIRVTVSMWRDRLVTTSLTSWPVRNFQTGTHVVEYSFTGRDNTLLLVQEFNEVRELRPETYYCASAVATRFVYQQLLRLRASFPRRAIRRRICAARSARGNIRFSRERFRLCARPG